MVAGKMTREQKMAEYQRKKDRYEKAEERKKKKRRGYHNPNARYLIKIGGIFKHHDRTRKEYEVEVPMTQKLVDQNPLSVFKNDIAPNMMPKLYPGYKSIETHESRGYKTNDERAAYGNMLIYNREDVKKYIRKEELPVQINLYEDTDQLKQAVIDCLTNEEAFLKNQREFKKQQERGGRVGRADQVAKILKGMEQGKNWLKGDDKENEPDEDDEEEDNEDVDEDNEVDDEDNFYDDPDEEDEDDDEEDEDDFDNEDEFDEEDEEDEEDSELDPDASDDDPQFIVDEDGLLQLKSGKGSMPKVEESKPKAKAKKPVAKKPVAKKPAVKKPAAKKPAAKKPAAEKSVAADL